MPGKYVGRFESIVSDCFAQHGPKCVGAHTGTRPNDYGGKLRGGRRAEQRHVEPGGLGLLIERTLHQRVRHDADDGAPRLFFAGIEDADLMSERALVAPILLREARIHDRDRLLRVGVVDGEIAAFVNLEAEGGEVIVGDGFEIAARTIAIGQIILPVDFILPGRCEGHAKAIGHGRGFELRISAQRANRAR